MKTRRFNDEVFFADETVPSFSDDDVDELAAEALSRPSGKKRICLHQSLDASVHEMLIAMRGDVQYPIHKHLHAGESYQILRGKAALVLYSDTGETVSSIPVGVSGGNRQLYVRIPPGIYHTLVFESELCVYLEVRPGPFNPHDIVLAPFSNVELPK